MAGLRVIVGEEDGGPRSQLWRVFTGKTSDVYIGSRPIAGEVRVSLHERGPWRFAFTEKHRQRPNSLIPPDLDRARHKWDRPPEFAPGLTRAFMIVVPSSELRAPREPDQLKKPAIWLPPPGEDKQVEIDLFLVRGARPDEWPGQRSMSTQLLYRQALPSGEELIVVSHVVETSQDIRDRLAAYKRTMLEAQRDFLLANTYEESSLRGVLFAVPGPDPPPDLRGVCAFYDVALPRPVADAA